MGSIAALILILGNGALVLWLFWPGPDPCKRCGTDLDVYGYCPDLTCPHSDYQQYEDVPDTWEATRWGF